MADSSEGAKLAPPIDYAQLSSTAAAPPPADTTDRAADAAPADKAAVVDLVTGQGSHGANTAGAARGGSDDVPAELVDSPAPAAAHPEPASSTKATGNDEPIAVDTAKASTALAADDKAPLPTAAPAPPATESVSSADAAPRPAVEAAPVQHDAVPQQHVAREAEAVDLASRGHATTGNDSTGAAAVVTDSSVARPPTRTDVPAEGMRETGHAESAPPATTKPVVPSAESHLAEHPATSTDAEHVLPLGSDVHPVHQAAALADAPDHLVNAQVEKHKADRREVFGEEPQGTIVPGLEDDKLWAMIRRFDVVSSPLSPLASGSSSQN